MKKFSNILLKVFSIGVLVTLFSGALTLVGFIVAMFIGGETATQICVFIHKTLFPFIIKFTSIFVGVGLIAMYLLKIKALASNDSEEK
jgi:hypothetical protein